MKKTSLILFCLIIQFLNNAFSQLQGVDQKSGDIFILVSLDELEKVIDSCNAQIGIGAALNYLSNSTWELQGGGQNVLNGDSLFYSMKLEIKNKEDFYAFVMDYQFDARFSDYPNVKMKVSQYMLQFQFADKNNFNLIVDDLKSSGYSKRKEEFFDNHSVLTFEKNASYVAELFSIKSNDGTIYLYRISNKSFE